MNRLLISCLVAFAVTAAGGCAVPKPEFNRTYVPGSVPGSPQKRIDLTGGVASAKKSGAVQKNAFASLYWAEQDALLLTLWSKDRKDLVYGIRIAPDTGEMKMLDPAEKEALLSRMKKDVAAVESGSALAEFAKFAMQATAALAGGGGSGSGGSAPFLVKIENNGYVLDISAAVKRNKWAIFPSTYNCSYTIRNRQTGEALTGNVKIEKTGNKQESLMNWVRSLRIAPDGRTYLIGGTATLLIRQNKQDSFLPLIEHYPFSGADVSPGWDRLAVLVIKEDEKTKQMNYWVEIYPFDYKRRQ